MKQRNLTSTPANVSSSRHQCWSKLHIRIFRPDGKYRQGFISILLLIMILLSPLGSSPAHALVAPGLIAPGDGSTVTGVEAPPLGIPEFNWAEVPGAKQYRLQVSSVIGFNTTILDITTPNTTFTPTSSNPFSDGDWYWRVRVESPAPIGDYSSIWSFTKQWATSANQPTLISPSEGATIDFYDATGYSPDTPVFSWSPVTGAARYKLQIYASPGGWNNPITPASTTTVATTHQPIAKLANGDYYWRVVPVDPGSHDGYPSEERTFTTNYNPVLTLLEPENGSFPTFTPTFRWTAVRGAQFYRLQYATDTNFSSNLTTIDTRSTTYTPINALPNDVNYYWRVRVHVNNSSISDWTGPYSFYKKWYIKPVLLTPTTPYTYQRFPLFSWTPVPGAGYYKIELDKDSGFGSIDDTGNTANPFYSPNNYEGGLRPYYWRVTPYDGSNNPGKSNESGSYVSDSASVAPHQVYPLFYYPPDTYPDPFSEVSTNPHEDRSVPLPIFIWHRVLIPLDEVNAGQVYAEAYRLQVSADPTFTSGVWSVDTENTVATPTAGNPFTPANNTTDYFWRVRPLIGGGEVAHWSQTWKTRIDSTRGLASTYGASPTLIRPTTGYEFAETTPLLEWFPLSGATSYDVQISLDESFGSTVDTAAVSYPAYAPTQSLAQRSLGDVNFGVYYWRVRSTGGAWSEPRRFQISAQSQYQITRALGDADNQLQIGSDAASDVTDPDYDLTNLQVAQDSNYWYFGFYVPGSPAKNVTYALYLDLDHQAASVPTSDARSFSVTTIPAFRPEYAIYLLREAGSFNANKVYIYHWNDISWDMVGFLVDNGGLTQTSNYVEIRVLNGGIGYNVGTGSYAISLFSLQAGGGAPQDSVPSDPNVPGSGILSRFSNVTERMNIVMPPNNAGVDPSVFSSIQPFFWDWPILTPYSGGVMKAYLDSGLTNIKATYSYQTDHDYWANTSYAWNNDFVGDNTYYWRIQPDYNPSKTIQTLGAWSQAWRIERQGFVPQNLQTHVDFATPTFSWDMAEGADYYELWIDDDPGFGNPTIINTRLNSYTHTSTLAKATYYWRVRIHRYGSVTNYWTDSSSFSLALPLPTGLYHEPSGVVGRAPTLCWTPLIENSPATGDPVLAAWKYRIQVSREPTFSSSYEPTVDTEQSCWTSTRGYDDGQYYWHVAMMDGDGKLGDYSPYQTFTKQYPVTTLVSPLSGAIIGSTPTFIWTPVYGAAHYRLEVSLVENFATTFEGVTTDNLRYTTPSKTYLLNKTYYWRVAIMDADGKYGPWTNATIILDLPYGVFLPIVKKR